MMLICSSISYSDRIIRGSSGLERSAVYIQSVCRQTDGAVAGHEAAAAAQTNKREGLLGVLPDSVVSLSFSAARYPIVVHLL